MTIKHLVHNAQTSKSGLDTTSWCRKSLFDQSFQSNTVIKWFQFNFQIFECITNHFGQLLFGIEQIPSMVHIKNHPPSLLNFFIWVNANGLLLLLRKKGRSWACRQVSDVHLWCFWFLFKYWYRMQQRFFLGKKRVKISYSWEF